MSNAAAHDPATDSTLLPPRDHDPLTQLAMRAIDCELRSANAAWLYGETLAKLAERDAQVADLTRDLAAALTEIEHLRRLAADVVAAWNGGDK